MDSKADEVGAHRVVGMVEAQITRCSGERLALLGQRPGSFEQHAVRADRLAQLYEREARWWGVLGRCELVMAGGVPVVFARAVAHAVDAQAQRAVTWRELAADWRHQARGERVCVVIGCGCGGTDRGGLDHGGVA